VVAVVASASELPAFEPNPQLRASEILLPEQLRSEDHVVREIVNNDGFLNHYVVETPFGDFDAEGNRLLIGRVQEAHALAELDRVSKSDLYLDAAKRVVVAPVQAVSRFVVAPVDTVKGIPGGVSRAFRSIGRKAKSGAKNSSNSDDTGEATGEVEANGEGEEAQESDSVEATEPNSKVYARKWFGVTGSERRWAKKLGVDPYTDNELLREEIRAVAKVDAAASFGAKLMMPGLGAVSYVVTVSNLVWSLDPEELRAYNVKQLAQVGVSEAAIDGFLNNQVFSPTQQTVIVQAMVEMKDVEDLEKVLLLSSWAETATQAWFYAETISLTAQFHESVRPVRAIVGEAPVPGLLTKNGELVYVVPLDHLTWNETVAELVRGSMIAGTSGVEGSRELWLDGTATETASAGLAALDWSVESGISFD